jgi:hypothetical protein
VAWHSKLAQTTIAIEERLEQIKRMQGYNIFDNKMCGKEKHDNPWNPMEESHHVGDLN